MIYVFIFHIMATESNFLSTEYSFTNSVIVCFYSGWDP